MVRRAAVAWMLAGMLLASCGGDGSSGADLEPLATGTTSAGVTSPTVTEDEPPTSVVDPSITLLDAGAEPRRELRLAAEIGSSHRFTSRIDMRQTLSAPGEWLDLAIPIFELDYVATVTAVESGRITFEQAPFAHRIVDARGVDPANIADLEMAFDLLIDLGNTVVVIDDRGRTISRTMMGEGALYDLPGMENALGMADDVSLPVPVEAVGIGARWQIDTNGVSGGIHTNSRTTVELVEVHDDRFVARLSQEFDFPRSFIEGTNDRDEVLDGHMTSTGTMTWHLASPLPLVNTDASGSIRTSSFRGGSSFHLTIDQEIASTMTPIG